MSYCRWSTDDFMCDLYCYQSDTAYVTHVAGNRAIFRPWPAPGFWLMDQFLGLRRYRFQLWLHQLTVKLIPRRNIGLPYDSRSFYDPDLETFRLRLLELRMIGYQFPDYVLDAVAEEIQGEQ